MSKKYKLLKDLPQCKAGTIFEKYANDACDYVAIGTMVYSSGDCRRHEFFLDDKLVEDNHEWFEPVVERENENEKEMSLLSRCLAYFNVDSTNVPEGLYKDVFNILYPPPQQSKQPETKVEFSFHTGYVYRDGKKSILLYTEQQLNEERKKVWKAARKLINPDYHHMPYAFFDLETYLNSIK